MAEAVATLGLKHAVVTSVNRDDDNIGGAPNFRRDHPRDSRTDSRLPRRSPDPRFSGTGRIAAHRSRRPARRAQPQHRNRAAPLSRGALRRALRAHADPAGERQEVLARHGDQERRDGRPGRNRRTNWSRSSAIWARAASTFSRSVSICVRRKDHLPIARFYEPEELHMRKDRLSLRLPPCRVRTAGAVELPRARAGGLHFHAAGGVLACAGVSILLPKSVFLAIRRRSALVSPSARWLT